MFHLRARILSFWRTFLVLALIWGPVRAISAAPPHYFARTWQVESGLPQNKVTAVLQTRDGYLWVGTYNGLARFDGVNFKVFDDNNTPELHSSRITSLCEASDGTLWIGDESGQVTQYKNGQFTSWPFHSKWSGGKIYRIAVDDSQDVWLMNEAGELARVRDGLFLAPRSGNVAKVVSLARSVNGSIWIARDGVISLLQHGHLSALTTNIYVQGICASADGGLWVASNAGLREWKNGRWTRDLGAAPWGWNIISDFIELDNGALAAGSTDSGLYLIFPSQPGKFVHFDRTNGFPSDWVISLWQDREGNLWSGTGAGLVMTHPGNLQTISPPDQWQGRAVLSVCSASNDTLWVGTEGAGLYRFQNGVWTNYNSAQGVRNQYIWSLAEDRAGGLYAGSWGGGLFAEKDGAFDFAPGMENLTPPMPALLFGPDDLWIGTTAGLLHYQKGSASWVNTASGKFSGDVRALARDSEGAIWVGTAGDGLTCLRNQTARQFRRSDGLSSDFIECLRFDQDGTLWIGTFGGGLNRFKNGRFSVINMTNGLPNNVVCDIELDDRGFIWMSSYGGIIRVSQTELNRCADGKTNGVHCLVYGIDDGLPTLQMSEGLQPAGCRTADGRLWFPTARGLVSVDPASVTLNPLPPSIVVEEMRVDDRTFAVGPTIEPLKIAPGHHRFDFHYTALSFIVPEKVQFKCRLIGLDDGWVDMGTKRLSTYSYIPPGDYSFQVIACNNDGVWNESGASMAFRVLPYFWQTAWFRLLALAVLLVASGALVWFDTRRRMRRRLELVERQRDIERERTRIARDIHDDLGSHLTRITMISESARADSKNPTRILGGLEQIYGIAHELTQSMDEIVWAVSPRHDTLESLAAYLEKFAQDWLAAAGIRCRIDMPMQFPEWHLTSEIRHNLFLACKEALHNVVKHSGASEVYIRMVIAEKTFRLSIEDNGCGFSPEIHPHSPLSSRSLQGNGLENMLRRLSAIGGNCDIHSEPGKGTKVTFTSLVLMT